MRKRFNTTGSCNPERHYMVDTAKRFEAVEALIDAGEYFTINRARQYGKTTMLVMIWRRLSGRYLVVPMSFEGLGDSTYASEAAFVSGFSKLMARHLTSMKQKAELVNIWQHSTATTLDELALVITDFCRKSDKPVVLTIDEVDKNSDNQLFLNFLGMLRNKYLERDIEGMDYTFHSIVLAGVYDVKNLKLKIRPEGEKKYNSPWNIAADFNVDMTFHPEEIAQMLADYEHDAQTGMDIMAISKEIYKYTTGYPFMVSYICKKIDEELGREWTADNIVKVVKTLAEGGSTLMDDLSKNVENNAELRDFLFSIAVNGQEYVFTTIDPLVNLANTFSYIRKNQRGKTMIHNLIFEEALYMYFGNKKMREQGIRISPYILNYVSQGRLMMEHVVTRFRDLMHEEYRESTTPFLEREGRLLFITFLKPIINGTGFYYVEPQTRDNRRMDLVVTYGKEEFIVELKIWRGNKYEENGRDQLADYLATRGMTEGYLVTFDFSKNPHNAEPQWIEHQGKHIFEVTIT